jgi:hypothetical protein
MLQFKCTLMRFCVTRDMEIVCAPRVTEMFMSRRLHGKLIIHNIFHFYILLVRVSWEMRSIIVQDAIIIVFLMWAFF